MKVDTHILFLIIVVGIISAGLVGATVMSNNSTMVQKDFDGMKVSVPSDSNFVKVGEGVYKDSGYGITINTFQNNNSMINFLKNTKNSKVVPLENQPPQSVAFKKGDTISILVTNGLQGMAIESKDGKLTTDMANTIIFSNNHKSVKPSGIGPVQPRMNIKQDFNLIMLLAADVDTKIFNVGVIENNALIVIDDYNENIIEAPADDVEENEIIDNDYVSDVENNDDLANILTENDTQDASSNSNIFDDANHGDNGNSEPATTEVVSSSGSSNSESPNIIGGSSSSSSSAPSSSASSSSSGSSGSSASSNSQPEPLTLDQCKQIALDKIGQGYTLDINYESGPDYYTFFVLDNMNMNTENITVSTVDGSIIPNP